MIFSKYASISMFNTKTYSLMEKGDINRSLHEIYKLVDLIFTEPVCTAQVFSSHILDQLCETIGNKSFSSLSGNNHIPAEKSPLIVYLVTKLQKSGGHTRVLEDFIRALPDKNHVILSTELAGNSDKDYVDNKLISLGKVSAEYASSGNFSERLTWLQKRLIELNPSTAYLFNHHQDSVAVAAIQPEMNINTYFYHHGDHHLCLGVYLSHAKHIDIHPMGYHNCRKNMGIENIYIPLTVDDKGCLPENHIFRKNGELVTCTAARSNKIEIPYCENYLEIIPELLAKTGGKHVHIGNLSPWGLWKLRRNLRRLNISDDKFIYVPWVASVWEALKTYHVDIYLTSFPYPGALTLIEVMGAGIPVIMHKHAYSHLLSCIDLAYPEAFAWASKDELFAYCQQLDSESLAHQSRLARQRYETFHRKNVLIDALNNGTSIPVPALAANYPIRQDDWGFYLLNQISFTHILRREVYRLARYARLKLQQLRLP